MSTRTDELYSIYYRIVKEMEYFPEDSISYDELDKVRVSVSSCIKDELIKSSDRSSQTIKEEKL